MNFPFSGFVIIINRSSYIFGPITPPTTSLIITETNDNIITEDGNLMITE